MDIELENLDEIKVKADKLTVYELIDLLFDCFFS